MNPRTMLAGLCLTAMLAATSCACPQASAPQGMQPLPWGPAVPRSLHSAAEALRTRALNHCVRARVAKGMAKDLADVGCRGDLPRGNAERSFFRVARH